jgi:hypothetical protein
MPGGISVCTDLTPADLDRRRSIARSWTRLTVRMAAALLLASGLACVLPATTSATYGIDNYMFPVGDIPQGLHAGDCNGDGIPDVIVADQGSNDIAILRNIGDGHFAFFTSFSATGAPRGALCANFTNDNLADIATIDRDNGNVYIYQQKPTGGYQKLTTIPIGKQPNSVSAGDLDHDGNMDLVVISTSSQIMVILFGDGHGAFPRSTSIALPMATPLYAAIGDFNLDNNLDIAVGGGGIGTRALIFYMGNGQGIFTPSPTTVPSLPIPRALAASDLDHDGVSDLAILTNDGTVVIYIGSPSGTFTLANTLVLPLIAQSIDFEDFNDDGIMDLAIGCGQINSVMILRGLGGAEFAAVSAFDTLALSTIVSPAGSGVSRAVPVDQDSRMVADIGRTELPTNDLLMVNDSTKTLEAVDVGEDAAVETAPVGQVKDAPTTVLLADMNNDGTQDAIVTTKTRHGIGLEVLFGNANGGYDAPAPGIGTCGNRVPEPGEVCDNGAVSPCKACVPQIGSGLVSIAAGDVNGDGNQDLVVVGAPGRLLLMLGNGNGQFTDVRLLGKTAAKIAAALGDFDGDGILDIVAVLHQKSASGLTLLHNDGTGSFATLPIPLATSAKGPLLAADFDRNGALDVAVGTAQRGKTAITVLLNDGSGTSPTVKTIPIGRGLKSLSSADFNEDGWLDVLGSFGTGTQASVTLYPGNANGEFAASEPAIDSATLGSAKGASATILDVNDDGHQDVVVCRSSPQTSCSPHFGTGRGQFLKQPPPNANYIGRQLRSIAVKDLDGDGVLDFIGVSRRDNRVVILFRDASMAVTLRLTLPTGGIKPRALAIGDLDGDNRPDIVVANETTADLTFFLNKGNRIFQTVGPVSLKAVGSVPTGIGLVDLNGNSKLDVVVAFQGTSNLGFFLIQDITQLTGGGFVNIGSMPTGAQPVQMIVAEINGDLIPDLITVNNKGVPPPAAATATPTTAATPVPTATDVGGTPGPTRTPTPIATSTPGSTGSISIFSSTSVGNYSRTDLNPGGTNTWAVHERDINHDDALDLLVINSQEAGQPGLLVTFLNDGFGNFTKASTNRRGRKNPRDLCTGDFNGDGDIDVAVASTITKDVLLLFGNGDGTWKRGERVYSVGNLPRSAACEDVDGDGLTDVIFGRLNRGDIDIIRTGN